MAELRHDTNGMPVIQLLSKLPSRRLKSIGEQFSFIVLSVSTLVTSKLTSSPPISMTLPNSFIEHVATMHNISLRTGCMCNPGGASALLGIQQIMESLCDGATLRDVETHVGRELGVVRVSLGLGSDWGDVWRVIRFLEGFGDERRRLAWWDAWAQVPIGQAV
jgi:molybdenum cofactor sulfurtransferase